MAPHDPHTRALLLQALCGHRSLVSPGVTAVIYLVDFTETSSRLAGLTGYSVPGMVFMTALRVPLILQQTIPFVALFVGMTTLIALNRKYELVVVRAAGISVWQFMLPFCIGALLLGLGAMLVINPLAAWGQRQALNIERRGGKPAVSQAAAQPCPGSDRSAERRIRSSAPSR